MKHPVLVLFLFSLVLTILIFIPYSINLTHGLPNVIDPLFYAWNLSHNADNIFNGMNRLLNTNIFYPLTNTLAYSDTLWGQGFITSPVIWLTGNPILAENIAIFISFPLSAISMYFLAYYFTRNIAASCAAGLFFAFSYPRISQIGHLPMVSSQWLPLYMLYLFKFLKEGKRINFFFLCFWYLLSTASSIYFGIFLIPVTVIIVIADFFRRIQYHTLGVYKKRVLATIPAIGFFLILLALILFPYIRLRVENPVLKRTLNDIALLRAQPIEYISVLPTSLISPYLPKAMNEHVLYPTMAVLVLAFLGVVLSWKRNRYMIVVYLSIVVISFILSLGNEQSFSIGPYSTGVRTLPYFYLYILFPVFQAVRVPARFSIFIIVSLSMLAAWGIDCIMKRKHSKLIIGVFLCIFLIEIWQVNTTFVTIPLKKSIPPVYTWVRLQPEPMILAELPASVFYHGKIMEDQLNVSYDKLQKSDTYALETYRVYFSAFHKKRILNGYSGYYTGSYNEFAGTLENFPSQGTILAIQKLGITHIIVHSMQYDPNKRNEILGILTNSPLVSLSYSDSYDFVYKINKKDIQP